ncbi:MAG: hypothetical protein ABI680_14275 [Chthoniobacteraceae bacterium]
MLIEPLESRIAPASFHGVEVLFLGPKTSVDLSGGNSGIYVGQHVAGFGDLNGDGFGDYPISDGRFFIERPFRKGIRAVRIC